MLKAAWSLIRCSLALATVSRHRSANSIVVGFDLGEEKVGEVAVVVVVVLVTTDPPLRTSLHTSLRLRPGRIKGGGFSSYLAWQTRSWWASTRGKRWCLTHCGLHRQLGVVHDWPWVCSAFGVGLHLLWRMASTWAEVPDRRWGSTWEGGLRLRGGVWPVMVSSDWEGREECSADGGQSTVPGALARRHAPPVDEPG